MRYCIYQPLWEIMLGHLLLQSSLVGCIAISQNLVWTMPEQNISHGPGFSLGRLDLFYVIPSRVTHFAVLEHTVTRRLCYVYESVSTTAVGRNQLWQIREENDCLCRQWADWPGEKWWKWGRENEGKRERQVVSGTIQLPSELYWISPPFKIERQISLSSHLDLTGRITLFF